MKANSPINEVVIANALVAIFERLDSLEKATNILAGRHLAQMQVPSSPPALTTQQAALIEKLEKLTLKRHAVLTATLGGQTYDAIARAMACDPTTVKLHLKAALNILGIRSRSTLLAMQPGLLDFLGDEQYERRFAITKRWWLTEKPSLMAVLRATKPSKNQYTHGSKP